MKESFMSEFKEVSIDELADEIEVNQDDFRRLLMGIGFNEILNEASRYSAIENWNNKTESPTKHPTIKHLKKVVQEYMGEAIKDGHIKMN